MKQIIVCVVLTLAVFVGRSIYAGHKQKIADRDFCSAGGAKIPKSPVCEADEPTGDSNDGGQG